MDNYPPGAADDPRAPWNEPAPEPYQVWVSITLSKEFTVDAYKEEQIDEGIVRLYHFLPDEILKLVSEPEAVKRNAISKGMMQDAADWVVDDISVTT